MDEYIYPYNTSWFDLPLEMREHVIKQMDFRTRCRFSDCSTICESEAIQERLFSIWSIEFDESVDGVLEIQVAESFDDRERFPTFKFEKLDEHRTIVKYLENIWNNEFSTTIANGSPTQVRAKYANYFFGKFQDSIDYCTVVDRHEVTTLEGIKFPFLNLDQFICSFDIKNWEYFHQNGIFELEEMRYIDYLELSASMRIAFDFALKYKGGFAEFHCEDFDQQIIDDYLSRVKIEGMHEESMITVSFASRRLGFTIDVQKLAPIKTWQEKHHCYSAICKNVVIETESGGQKIHIIYYDTFIQLKIKKD
ncbi:unnamed protein product [Caenorhabditis angaria]|uniref:F-box domain-containing protein n=1 Tax=Caenorhabditis angaria TaxID=860376 RepID=A0A9P1IT38_9PELO|nr:unnamed protein product [Caenorhabditis angaria]